MGTMLLKDVEGAEIGGPFQNWIGVKRPFHYGLAWVP